MSCPVRYRRDPQHCALAIEWDCEWITLDRDYGRFRGLKWRPPEPRK